MLTLADFVRENAPARAYYESVFSDIRWPQSGSEGRVACVFHSDNKTPSLSINPENGKWFCHACEAGGNSIVSFHAKLKNIRPSEAAKQLYHQLIHPVISDYQVESWHKALLNTPTAMNYLTRERFLLESVIVQFRLGWNGRRIIFPIFNEFGLCVNAKMLDPLAKPHNLPKMLNYQDKQNPNVEYGSPTMLYPLSVLAPDVTTVQIEEGELDALLQITQGIPTVTTTAGSKSWPSQYNEFFRGKRVILGGDNDEPGASYRSKIISNIGRIAKEICQRELTPKKIGKDCTDWWKKDPSVRNAAFWKNLVDSAKTIIDNPPSVYEQAETQLVPLEHASKAEWYGTRIKVSCIITGKDTAPYLLPKKVRLSCDRSCDTCPLADSTKPFKEINVEPDESETLELLDITKGQLKKRMLAKAGMTDKFECRSRCDVIETFNVEELILIPTLSTSLGQYVMRTAYYIGHGLLANRSYDFEGVTLASPTDQHSTHLFDKAKPIQDEVETFNLTPQLIEQLKVFRTRNLGQMAQLMHIAEWQSRNVTKIRERPDLHIAIDLAFHSVASFEFNGELVPRGMLDILVIGDTRCGKGYVAEGLTRYYGLGEVASGESCSFAGLIGGLQQAGSKRWLVTWGMIPHNHNRLVIIDEASALSERDFSNLSRVRSEGVASITKIVTESTRASARLVWLSNPRTGRAMREYNSGVQAIKELVGANEDVARFDFAMTVATNEVPSEVINTPFDSTQDAPLYPRELCRSLVLWAWSRRPDQIKFTPQATDEVIVQAIQFGKSYSSTIPLVQAENIRIKIAKVSAAVAARLFSSNETGEQLVIDASHVKTACHFMRMIYAKPSMAYDSFSDRVTARTTIPSTQPIDTLFSSLGSDRAPAISGLHDLYRITPDNLADYVGDLQAAKSLLAELVKLNCVQRSENCYFKNPAFKSWLTNQQRLNGSPKGGQNGQAQVLQPSRGNGRSTEAHRLRATGHGGNRQDEISPLRK